MAVDEDGSPRLKVLPRLSRQCTASCLPTTMRPTDGSHDGVVGSWHWAPKSCRSTATRSVRHAVRRTILMLEQINHVTRDEVECGLEFAGFLVFHCPLKADAVESLKMLADSSHRVSPSSCSVLSVLILLVYYDHRRQPAHSRPRRSRCRDC